MSDETLAPRSNRRDFDVFLSYSSRDRREVERVADRLRRNDIRPWFDRWHLTPGGRWSDEIAAGLLGSAACAVFIGRNDLGAWTRMEVEVAVNRAAHDRDFALIPVLLPGLDPFDPADLPPFLATRMWVDLRDGVGSETGLRDLVRAVVGIPFGSDMWVDPQPDDECPYRGLEFFDEQHTKYYFGREVIVQRLVEKLKGNRFIAVVGPSGSGKSSLVRAGLLPRVRAGALPGSADWRVIVLRPGPHPIPALAGGLLDLDSRLQSAVDGLADDERTLHLTASAAFSDGSADRRLLIVVDQCEELFTLCRDEVERSAFLRNLHYASIIPDGRLSVVLTLRSDFYARVVEAPGFAQLVQSNQILLGGLTVEQLRRVIEEPAEVAGLEVEHGLADTIVAEVVRDTGSLPLLEHALLETWRRRRGRVLTLAGYRDTGGVLRGLAERAEAVYEDLTPEGRETARRLLLRLTQPDSRNPSGSGDLSRGAPVEGIVDTRRRIFMREVSSAPDGELASDVIDQLVAERLLTMSAAENAGERWVEVSHEALIQGWPRLRGWIDADRAGLRIHRQLTFAAEEWQRLGRDNDLLYRGLRLAEALGWRQQQPGWLNWTEDEFLEVSRAAEWSAQSAHRRRVRTGMIAVVLVMAVISGAALVAINQSREATRQRDVAISRQLATSANDALGDDPSLGLTLALRAFSTAPTVLAERALRRSTEESRVRNILRASGGWVTTVRILADGHHVISGSDDGALRLWDLDGGQLIGTFAAHQKRVYAVRPALDGRLVASAGDDGIVAVTDLSTGSHRAVLRAPQGAATNLDLSPDGKLIAASMSTGEVQVIDLATDRVTTVLGPAPVAIYDVAFSADGRRLVTAGADGSVTVLSTSGESDPQTLRGPAGALLSAEFDPSGNSVLTAGEDGMVRLWDLATGQPRAFPVSPQTIFSARFSPDGRRFLAAGQDGLVRVWDLDGIELVVLRGHVDYVFDATFTLGGAGVISAGSDGTLRVWAISADQAVKAPVTGAAVSADGSRLVTGGVDGHVRVWALPALTLHLDLAAHTGRSSAAFSADGKRIVSNGEDGDVRVWDAVTGQEQAHMRPHTGRVWVAVFDPRGDRVATGGDDGKVVISSLVGAAAETFPGPGGPVCAVRFSPDGLSIVSGGEKGSLRRWGPNGSDRTISSHDGAVTDIAFTSDGLRLASAGANGVVRLWTPALDPIGSVLRGHEGGANAVRFSPDGERLTTAGDDGTIRMWDASSSQLLLTMPLFTDPASTVDLTEDGRLIVSASEGGQFIRTSTCGVCGPITAVLALARSRPVRPLTPEEEERYIPAEPSPS